jgi:phenylacetate-CoA ligase
MHAYNNVPFYHGKLKEAGLRPEDIHTLEDLQKFPITTKNELKAYTLDKIVAHNYSAGALRKRNTGGSTDKPFVFFKDTTTVCHELAALYRFRSWYGFFGFKQALTFFPYCLPWSKEFKSFLENWLISDRNEQTLSKYAHWMKRFRPKVLEGSPVGFYVLVNFLKKERLPDINLSAVLATSETLFSFQRQAIESAFNCRVFNLYGSNEIGSIAQECEEHTGLHINAEDRIVEFIRGEEGVSPGEMGEVVITDLENYAMPFIRYNIEDVGVPMADLCSCGRGLPLIKEINGRATDLIVSSDGNIIPGDIIAQFILFRDHKWTQQFQVVQPSRRKISIKIVKSPESGTENLQLALRRIHKCVGNMKLETEFVESIVPPLSGKSRFIISEASHEFFSKPMK